MVKVIRDENGNIVEVTTGLWDKLNGNDVKVKGSSVLIEENKLFGLFSVKTVLPMKKTVPVKEVKDDQEKEIRILEKEIERLKLRDKKNMKVKIAGQEVDANELPDDVRKKLGID